MIGSKEGIAVALLPYVQDDTADVDAQVLFKHCKILMGRVANGAVKEVILATSATVDGQTTAHYLSDRLAETGVAVTEIAHGVPVGGELDYLDDGTLAAALKDRRPVQ